MASGRIPAWQRLGLKLHKSDQSTSQNGLHLAEHRNDTPAGEGRDSLNSLHPSVEPPGQSASKLGKRKHREHPAEGEGESLRKSKKEPRTGNASLNAVPTSVDENAQQELQNYAVVPGVHDASTPGLAAAALSRDNLQKPKGDPNYRRKKGRRQVEETKHLQTVNHMPFRPSLSPGQPDLAADEATLVVSTETDFPPSPTTPQKLLKTQTSARQDSNTKLSSSPSRTDRRKSVTFTPDTKTTDGNSASNLFKKWVQDQNGPGAEFTQAEVAQFAPPPTLHPANQSSPSTPTTKEDRKAKRAEKKAKQSSKNSSKGNVEPDHSSSQGVDAHRSERSPPSTAPVPKTAKHGQEQTESKIKEGQPVGKKKDPSRYLNYLTQYHTDRPNWKFNKAIQNDIIDNCLNIFRIPDEHAEALIEYVKGLKGAGVVERLKQSCKNTIAEIDTANEQETSAMDDPDVRKAAQEEALQERLSKERKRRRVEGDVENMSQHPYPDGYVRRLKRARAETLLTALNIAAPVPAASPLQVNGTAGLGTSHKRSLIQRKLPPKKKLRTTAVSSDESSDSSSSEESSSEEEESDGNSTSGLGSSSTSSSDNETASGEDSDSGSDDASSSSSESGSSGSEGHKSGESSDQSSDSDSN